MRSVRLWVGAWGVWALVSAGWCWRVAYERWPELRLAFGAAGLLVLLAGLNLAVRWREWRRPAPAPATPPPPAPAPEVVAAALDRVWCAAVAAGTASELDEAHRERYRAAVMAAAARAILGQPPAPADR